MSLEFFDNPETRRLDVNDAKLWQDSRDQDALARVLRRADGILTHQAWYFRRGYGREFEFEDLKQQATLGAIRAVTVFDPAKSPSVRAWIAMTSRGTLQRYIRDDRRNNLRAALSFDDDRFEENLAEAIGELDLDYEAFESRETAQQQVGVLRQQLDPDDLDLLTASYVDEEKQRDIGKRLGYTQVHAGRLVNWAAERARRILDDLAA